MIVIGRGSRFQQVVRENRKEITKTLEVIKRNHFRENNFKRRVLNEKRLLALLSAEPRRLIVFCNYPWILNLNWSKLPVVICHAGQLPLYRGASVVNWAYINGENSISTSIIKYDKNVDAGNLLSEIRIKINDTPLTFTRPKIDKSFAQQIKKLNKVYQKQRSLPVGKFIQQSEQLYKKRKPTDSILYEENMSLKDLRNYVLSCEKGYWVKKKLNGFWYEIYYVSQDFQKIEYYNKKFKSIIHMIRSDIEEFYIIGRKQEREIE